MDIAVLQAALPADFPPLTPAGEGDYATAYRAGDHIVLLARSPHASRCLDTVARISPQLARHVTARIPAVDIRGEREGLTFIGYPAVPGEALKAERFQLLTAQQQQGVADAVGQCVAQFQSFPVNAAQDAGLVETEFPFAFLEDTLQEGELEALYAADLRAAGAVLTPEEIAGIQRRLEHHLATRLTLEPVVIHGEISQDHVLYDPGRGEVTGLIDLNGIHLGRPTRDLMYVVEEYGEAFTRRVLIHLPHLDAEATLEELRFLRLWHALVRLNWMHQHGYPRGVAHWQASVQEQLGTLAAQTP